MNDEQKGTKEIKIKLKDIYDYLKNVAKYKCSICGCESFIVSPHQALICLRNEVTEAPDAIASICVACEECGNVNLFDSHIIMKKVILYLSQDEESDKS